jgi:hypothetical protein
MLTTRAPTRSYSAARSALAWAAVLICILYAAFALTMAMAAVLDWLRTGWHGTGRSAPPLFVLHALSGAVTLLAGSLQLRLATRLLRNRRHLHRRLGQTYPWAAWISSLSSLGVAAFADLPYRRLPGTSDAGLRGLLRALGAVQLGLGGWMALGAAALLASQCGRARAGHRRAGLHAPRSPATNRRSGRSDQRGGVGS